MHSSCGYVHPIVLCVSNAVIGISVAGNLHADLAAAICSDSASKADKAMREQVRYGLGSILERFVGFEHSNAWRTRSS
jgi:hypothetical protein